LRERRECELTKDHGGMDLAVSIGGAVANTLLLKVIRCHGNHHSLLLQSVNVLHHTSSYQILPAG